ncbi:hypothetical protein Rrhod_0122 [Rhodococcus rhodnii LMG 5362]|uniref:MFS transporter n=1 Tax=Rhodococcus rhodnii LMG 5362 TaxID=1273125 RepID=R7WWR2_9NOCA|nr:hypothetical protein Rrhod_0122 [Rhodococcus rhodnii LMG 5362]
MLFAALIAPALLVMPLWYRYARRHGKRRGLYLASTMFVVACLALVPVIWAPGSWVLAPVALAGVAYAGMQAFPMALLPDVIEADARARGEERGGTLSGVWTALETAGLAFGPALFLAMLALGGFVSSTGDAAPQPDSAITAIAAGFSLVPAALVAVSIVVLHRFRPTTESAAEHRGTDTREQA